MDVDEPTVQRTLDDLSKKHIIAERSGFGSRVPKYQHRFCNTEFGTLKFTPQELAIVCELLLRGPQTPGELRPRAARMAPFTDAGPGRSDARDTAHARERMGHSWSVCRAERGGGIPSTRTCSAGRCSYRLPLKRTSWR